MRASDVVEDHPKRKEFEVSLQNAKASRCMLPLTLQEMSLENTMLEIERGLAHLERNAEGLRKLRHIDAGRQLSQWSRRMFRLSFDV